MTLCEHTGHVTGRRISGSLIVLHPRQMFHALRKFGELFPCSIELARVEDPCWIRLLLHAFQFGLPHEYSEKLVDGFNDRLVSLIVRMVTGLAARTA
jgi:hypothetical protein